MSNNTFVYPHPINTYLISHLGVSVDQFCALHGFVRSTVAAWITRERTVESLPASFIYSLALASSKPMDAVYSELLSLQDDYLAHVKKHKRTKKYI